MTAPFPLGSSVSYYNYGRDRKYRCRLVSKFDVQPGDMAIWSENGDPQGGGGQGGHVGVVETVVNPGHTFITMESYGHHGVGRRTRTDFWMWFVRWEGCTPAHVRQMSLLTDRCVAAQIAYYAGLTNTDNDSTPDRADLNNYMHPWAAIGVDCSGYTWAMFDCAVLFVLGNTPSVPTGGDDEMSAEAEAKIDAIHDALFKGETPSLLRDVNARLMRAWEYDPNDPYSAPLLKIADLHIIASAWRDGFINTGKATVDAFKKGIIVLRRNAYNGADASAKVLAALPGIEQAIESLTAKVDSLTPKGGV